jgi:hypothetical protein
MAMALPALPPDTDRIDQGEITSVSETDYAGAICAGKRKINGPEGI